MLFETLKQKPTPALQTIIFTFLFFIVISLNIFNLFNLFLSSFNQQNVMRAFEKGYEYEDFRKLLIHETKIGFLTNKDTSPEYNDGQFLEAQYRLAPLILDLNNPNHTYLILDCPSLIHAFDIMQTFGAQPMHINLHGKVLAKRL